MTGSIPILYVDDEPDIRVIVEMALKMHPDFDVRTAASGDEALRLLGEGSWRPTLIMIDVMMPGLTGPEVLERLRADPDKADIPVVFVTARARSQDIAGYMEKGAAGVFTKPFDPMSLAGEVMALLQKTTADLA